MNWLVSFSLLLCLFAGFACGNDAPSSATFKPVQAPADEEETNKDPMEAIRSKAIAESDTYGRVRQSLEALQAAYNEAEGKMPGVGKVNVFVDEDMSLLIRNEWEGNVIETKVNLEDLQATGQGMRLIPDNAPDEFPGLRIFTEGNKNAVEVFKNGKLIEKKDHLEFFLPDRAAIERITPAMVQTINIAKKKY